MTYYSKLDPEGLGYFDIDPPAKTCHFHSTGRDNSLVVHHDHDGAAIGHLHAGYLPEAGAGPSHSHNTRGPIGCSRCGRVVAFLFRHDGICGSCCNDEGALD